MSCNSKLLYAAVALTISLASVGCGKSDSSASNSGGSGAAVSGIKAEARDAALAEIAKHWTKGADGWTTAKTTGSPYAPDHYLTQIHEITVQGVVPVDLSDSDKMNGFEWAGSVVFKKAPCREAGDQGIVLEGMTGINVTRQRGQWSQWVDFEPEYLHVQKVKGKWQVQPDNWLLHGEFPQPRDYANAGVE